MGANSLIPDVRRQDEWIYLVNETLEGEKCIVPLLGKIAKSPLVQGNKSLQDSILRQHAEEVQHVKLFKSLVGQSEIEGSGYRAKLYAYVEKLPNITLKLFALQGMLEGFALGALRYRLKYVENSPSEKVDAQALSDELGHVNIAFDHFKYLQNEEGVVEKKEFLQVSRDINKILSESFSAQNIARLLSSSFGVKGVDAERIESAPLMQVFKSVSVDSVLSNRNQFIQYYEGVAHAST